MSGRTGQGCKICKHPEIARLELALMSGRSTRAIGEEFNVSSDSLQRHKQNHISPARKRQLIAGPLKLDELAKLAAESDVSSLQMLTILRNEGWSLYEECREKGYLLDAASTLKTILAIVSKAAELTGELRSVGLNIMNIHGNVNTIVGASSLDLFKEEIRVAAQRQALSNGAAVPAIEAPEAVE